MQSRNTAYIYTFFTILFWGGAASAFKLSLSHISPLTLLWSGSSISLLVMTFILITSNKIKLLFRLTKYQWFYLLLLGGINPFLYYVILFKAYDLLPGQVAMSLNYLWPVMLALLSVPVLKHSLNLRSLLSISLSFIGAIIIASGGNLTAWGQLNPTGVLLALVSTIVWALYWLFSTKMQVDAVIKLFIGFVSGTIMSVIYAHTNDQVLTELNNIPWIPVLYVGLFEMGVTFFIWLKALQLAPNAAKLGNLIYLTPFLSLLLLAFILQEEIHITTIAGLIVIISGIFLQQYWNSAKPEI